MNGKASSQPCCGKWAARNCWSWLSSWRIMQRSKFFSIMIEGYVILNSIYHYFYFTIASMASHKLIMLKIIIFVQIKCEVWLLYYDKSVLYIGITSYEYFLMLQKLLSIVQSGYGCWSLSFHSVLHKVIWYGYSSDKFVSNFQKKSTSVACHLYNLRVHIITLLTLGLRYECCT